MLWHKMLAGVAVLALAGCGSGAGSGDSDAGEDGVSAAASPAGSESPTDEGFAQQSAATIVAESERDMTALRSVRVVGALMLEGERTKLDLFLTDSGACEGSMAVHGAGGMQLKSVGGRGWMKADADFWRTYAGEAASTLMRLVGDRWVALPEDDPGMARMCDLDEMLSEADAADDDLGARVLGTEKVAGQQTVRVVTETEDGEELIAWVRVDDPHHVLKMEVAEGKDSGTIRFSDFDAERDIVPPARDDVVDLEQLRS